MFLAHPCRCMPVSFVMSVCTQYIHNNNNNNNNDSGYGMFYDILYYSFLLNKRVYNNADSSQDCVALVT
jgi:hypothetical protein